MTTLKTILDEFDKKFKPKFDNPFFREYNEPKRESEVRVKGSVKQVKQFLISSIKKALEEVEVEERTKHIISPKDMSNDEYCHYSGIIDGFNMAIELISQKREEFLKI